MADIHEHRLPGYRLLPARHGGNRTTTRATTTSGPVASARAHSLREVLRAPSLDGHAVLAGSAGLARPVERLNVMEVPDILPWVKPHELLLTTAYPLRDDPRRLVELVGELDDAGVAGIGVKLGRYIDLLPAAMLECAERRGFPVVRLPDHVSFDEVFDDVLSRILNRQALRLARAGQIHNELVEVVLAGGGTEEVVGRLATLLGSPVAVRDRSGQVLARSHEHWPRDRCGPEDGHETPIAAGARLLAHLAVADRPDDGDVLALGSAATVLALVLTTRAEIRAVTSQQRSELMFDLLAGRAGTDAQSRAVGLGWSVARPLIAIVLEVDTAPTDAAPADAAQPSAWSALVASIDGLVRRRDPAAAVVRIGDEVVALTTPLEGRTAAIAFARRTADEAATAVGRSVSAGLSRPIASIEAIPAGYEQATSALRVGRRVDGRGAVAHVDRLGAHRLLSLIDDQDELDRFVRQSLGPLAEDTDDAAELRDTLRVLLDTGCSIAETARRLHFHYNTVRYRIGKLEQLVGAVTDDARVRLDAQLALLVLDLHGDVGRRGRGGDARRAGPRGAQS